MPYVAWRVKIQDGKSIVEGGKNISIPFPNALECKLHILYSQNTPDSNFSFETVLS